MKFNDAKNYLSDLQNRLAGGLQKADGGKFVADRWRRAPGSGCAMSLAGGEVFERVGVNFSVIGGDALPAAACGRRARLAGKPYRAAGVSAVAHPQNPHCPTAHLNVRIFVCGDDWWFGGGMDLTPFYGYVADCRHFHRVCKTALDAHDDSLYAVFKQSCDDYFFIKHRNERRGIGGVFFDDFNKKSFAFSFAVARAVGDSFLSAYLPIIQKRRATKYGDKQKQWQRYRRGRYVEFNLIYDRGTLFGLQSGGDSEMVLMSLPPAVYWGKKPPTGQAETRLEKEFLRPREWASADG